MTDNAVMPVIIGTSGTNFALEMNIFERITDFNVATAPITTH